ncbi:hypothetical protein JK358_32375 [Nocardia sp. 2]|uniref:FAD-binding domain-containing protein n=1 Tax=Nocardia acididurans TaxID=2802282 RepID=A0ABS1MEN3_9NOCA|nr:hypothetical protein [Nocardia acididurans]MBL1079111.1 hypothetical protein [Nocardia acididurans]
MRRIKNDQHSAGVEIMRGDLVALLRELVGDAAEYRFADSITALDQDHTGVTVTFEHAPAQRFDLVIGADGAALRRPALVFGESREFVRHLGHYFAFAAADPALGADSSMTMFNTPGRMAGVYRSQHHAEAKAYSMFRGQELEFDHREPEFAHQLLRREFGRETSWRVPELLAGALADPDLYVDALAQVHLTSWARGRVWPSSATRATAAPRYPVPEPNCHSSARTCSRPNWPRRTATIGAPSPNTTGHYGHWSTTNSGWDRTCACWCPERASASPPATPSRACPCSNPWPGWNESWPPRRPSPCPHRRHPPRQGPPHRPARLTPDGERCGIGTVGRRCPG